MCNTSNCEKNSVLSITNNNKEKFLRRKVERGHIKTQFIGNYIGLIR